MLKQKRWMSGILSVLCLLTFSVNADDRQQALTLLEHLKSTKTLSADFQQVVTNEHGEVISRSQGHFVFKRPGKFRWDYVDPFEQLIIADGTDIWVYDIDLEQVSVRTQEQALTGTPALLLSGGIDVEQFFTIATVSGDDRLQWVQLTPKDDEGTFSQLRLGFNQDVLVKMQMIDHFNQRTAFLFTGVARNPDVPEQQFEFTPPEGVDVVGR